MIGLRKIVMWLLGFMAMVSLLTACILPYKHDHHVEFINEACIKPYQRYDYHTCDTLKVRIDGRRYAVPKNFKTNLASIPRILWPVLAPQYSAFVPPAILHDFLYHCPRNLTRKFADEVLYSALIEEGVTPYTASKFYLAVRLFGAPNFEPGKFCYSDVLISDKNYEFKFTHKEYEWMS